jgi:hypothetical protein
MRSKLESDWLQVFTESEVEQLRKEADAADAADREVDGWTADMRVCLTGPRYTPTVADLAAQADADREQQQADRDYRELCRLIVFAAKCRCGTLAWLPCRVRKWLALGL